MFLLKFSMFQVTETSLSGAPVLTGLSDPGHLNDPAPFHYHSLELRHLETPLRVHLQIHPKH